MIEKTDVWEKVRTYHNRHNQSAQHRKSMDYQLNTDYFNDMGISGQLTVSFHMFRTNTSENQYSSILFCCHNTGGFVGNTGHTHHQLSYYMNVCYDKLLINTKKQLRKPRPWNPTSMLILSSHIYPRTFILAHLSFHT